MIEDRVGTSADEPSQPDKPVPFHHVASSAGWSAISLNFRPRSLTISRIFILFVFLLGLDLLLLLAYGLRWARNRFRRVGVAVAPLKQLHLLCKCQPFVCKSLPAGFDG
jgi:hypothetical protein